MAWIMMNELWIMMCFRWVCGPVRCFHYSISRERSKMKICLRNASLLFSTLWLQSLSDNFLWIIPAGRKAACNLIIYNACPCCEIYILKNYFDGILIHCSLEKVIYRLCSMRWIYWYYIIWQDISLSISLIWFW